MGLSLPPKRVLINLKPADLPKEGSHFDLPLALGVLAAMDVLPRDEIAGYAALGELSLDGSLNPVAGVLPSTFGTPNPSTHMIVWQTLSQTRPEVMPCTTKLIPRGMAKRESRNTVRTRS